MWTGENMRVGVTGGRDFADSIIVTAALEGLPHDAVLVHGAARGADQLCAERWESLGRVTDPHPANWGRRCDANCHHKPRTRPDGQRYCPVAGVLRNQEMLDSGLDLLLVFPGGKGTADMKRRAERVGIRIIDLSETE